MNNTWLRQARVWQALEAIGTRAQRVAAGSRTLRAVAGTARRLQRVVTGNRSPEQTRAAGRTSSPAVTNSRLLGWLTRVWGPVDRARRGSGLSNLFRSGRAYAQGSFLYRWLTAEPEPDVIVIDLRETLTVGPWLRGLERAIAWLLPAAISSRLVRAGRWTTAGVRRRPLRVLGVVLIGVTGLLVAAAGATGRLSRPLAVVALVLAAIGGLLTRVDLTLGELQETRAYQALAAAFAPPEPPAEQAERRQDGTDRLRAEQEDRATNDEPDQPDRPGEGDEQG